MHRTYQWGILVLSNEGGKKAYNFNFGLAEGVLISYSYPYPYPCPWKFQLLTVFPVLYINNWFLHPDEKRRLELLSFLAVSCKSTGKVSICVTTLICPVGSCIVTPNFSSFTRTYDSLTVCQIDFTDSRSRRCARPEYGCSCALFNTKLKTGAALGLLYTGANDCSIHHKGTLSDT